VYIWVITEHLGRDDRDRRNAANQLATIKRQQLVMDDNKV
jgi:hypothetical protein